MPDGMAVALIHPASIDLASLLTGLSALAILVVLARTRIAMVSALIALVIPTVVVILAGASSVARVGDAGKIPRGKSTLAIGDVDRGVRQLDSPCRGDAQHRAVTDTDWTGPDPPQRRASQR